MVNSIGTIDGPNGTVWNLTGSTIARGSRVKSTGTNANGMPEVALSGATDLDLGYATVDIPTGYYGEIKFANAPGTFVGIAATGGVTAGAEVYQAASGLVTATSAGATPIGFSWDTAAATVLFRLQPTKTA